MLSTILYHTVCCFQDKRHQLLNEIRTLCEAPGAPGLVEFYGAFYSPDSGQISIALEYMDGGSLADIVQVRAAAWDYKDTRKDRTETVTNPTLFL